MKPSGLRILSGPTSPASPKLPSAGLHFPNLPSPRAIPPHVFDERYPVAIELPSTPMPWIWSCHKCHTRYPLGATRRCLQDGHYFCGGTTVDPISGKVKKHRACVSEFDYTGWEEFGKWKGATNGRSVRHSAKHCQDECDFPSCCHWKEQDAIQNAKLDYTDPNRLDKKQDRSLIKGKISVQESTRDCVEKFRRAAEKHTMQVAKASLSPIEEDQQALPSVDAMPRFNGLGLHFPVMDFSKFKNSDTKTRQLVDKTHTNLEMPPNVHVSARIDDALEEDVDMKEWITGSPPSYSCRQPDAVQIPFDFKFKQGSVSLSDDDDSPVSPMRSVWDWTAGGIGTALSPPALPVEGEDWEEEVEDEVNDVDMLWGAGEWDKGGADMRPHSVD